MEKNDNLNYFIKKKESFCLKDGLYRENLLYTQFPN